MLAFGTFTVAYFAPSANAGVANARPSRARRSAETKSERARVESINDLSSKKAAPEFIQRRRKVTSGKERDRSPAASVVAGLRRIATAAAAAVGRPAGAPVIAARGRSRRGCRSIAGSGRSG